MTHTLTPIPVLPDSAPFTPEQRAWLNGFFAGLLNAQPATNGGAKAPIAAEEGAPGVEAEEEFPWHDPALSLAERLKLADDKPPARKLMAAMAQLDCGACGYVCKTYSEAIAGGQEKDLTKCSPGGRETSKKLKELLAQAPPAPSSVAVPAKSAAFDRNNPFAAPLLECKPLTRGSSAKDTRFVSFDLRGSGIDYEVGDALGVFPENCHDNVSWLIDALDADADEAVTLPGGMTCPLREALTRHCSITKVTGELLSLLGSVATDPDQGVKLKAMAADDEPAPEGFEPLDLLHTYTSACPPVQSFVAALAPLQPRLYSISSSLKAHPGQVHLTVGIVRFLNPRGRQCKGVASTFLAERLSPGLPARVFINKSHGFRPPADGRTPIIMVGPGTGVAPFRAFLQERRATGATGKNWLFFGDQKRDTDFLYQDELEKYLGEGTLSRLDTAFSRDQDEKVYVQHRMARQGAELWKWLQDGAHFYVCGDAKRMAVDVDNALKQIAIRHGGLDADAAKKYVAELGRAKRYCRDVY